MINGTKEIKRLIHIPLELSRLIVTSVSCSAASFCKSETVVSDGNTTLVNLLTFEISGLKNRIPVVSFDSLGFL